MVQKTAVSLLFHFYSWLLCLYPTRFRDAFGEEMISIFHATVTDAHHQGTRELVRLCWREMADIPYNLAAAYWNEFTYNGEVVMQRKADWRLWPSWIVLHLLSIPLAALLMLAIVIIVNGIIPYHEWTTAQYVQLPTMLLGFAVVTGTLQWLLLRRYLHRGQSWGLATTLGWLVAGCLSYLSWLIVEKFGYSDNEMISAGSMFVICGVTVGLFQYWVLRQVVTKAGWWIAASAIGYSSLSLLIIQPATSILAFVFHITLPAIITGIALFLLLRQTELLASSPIVADVPLNTRPQIKRTQKSVWITVGIFSVILFCLVAPLIWTVGQLTLAKADGIYATPEEAMTATILNNSGGYEIERIDILFARPNYRDGTLPHVWFVGANVYGDYRPDGKSTAPKGYWGAGSFHIKVADGWVHVPEGAFPGLMGRVMDWYGLEDCCSTE